MRLDGTLVYRNGQTLVEVVPGTAAALEADSPPPLPASEDLGMTYVEGEIVGSKCYLGVMNPGSGPAHRACARLCIQGGIPPLLQVRRDDGNTEGLVLVSSDGGPVGDELLPLVAEPVGVTGHLVRIGSSTFLQADAIDFRRLE